MHENNIGIAVEDFHEFFFVTVCGITDITLFSYVFFTTATLHL